MPPFKRKQPSYQALHFKLRVLSILLLENDEWVWLQKYYTIDSGEAVRVRRMSLVLMEEEVGLTQASNITTSPSDESQEGRERENEGYSKTYCTAQYNNICDLAIWYDTIRKTMMHSKEYRSWQDRTNQEGQGDRDINIMTPGGNHWGRQTLKPGLNTQMKI